MVSGPGHVDDEAYSLIGEYTSLRKYRFGKKEKGGTRDMKDGFDWIVENNQKIGRDQEAEKNKKKLRQIIANLLRKGTSAEIVSECTMVPLEEVLEIEAGLLQQA